MSRKTEEWVGKSDDAAPPPRVKLRLLVKHEGRCGNCTARLGPSSPAEFDHIIALADGGENRENNLWPLCRPCHALKTGKEAAERAWVRDQQKKQYGVRKKASMPGSRDSKWKRKMDGTVVRR